MACARARGVRPYARSRAPLAALVALLLALPSAGAAAQKQFAAGSLIIPTSVEYQSDSGLLSTYGLVYVALWKNADRIAAGKKPITFYWAVHPYKLSQYRCNTMTNEEPSYGPTYNDNDGCDLAVKNAAGQPVANIAADFSEVTPFYVNNVTYANGNGPVRASTTHGIDVTTKIVKYLGGVWIVDSTDRQAFLDMLATVPELAPFHKTSGSANYVRIHSAHANFVAPVASVLSQKPPRIALIGSSSQTSFLGSVLENAGICGAGTIANCRGDFAASGFTSGVVYDYYANPSDLLSTKTGFPTGRINAEINGELYGTFWAGDGANPVPADLANLSAFLDGTPTVRPGTAFIEYDSVFNIDNAVKYQTTTGIGDFNPDIKTFEDCNDSDPSATTVFFKGNGGSCLVYGGANQPYAQTGNFLFDGGQGSYKGYTPLAGFRTGVTQVLKVGGAGNPTVASALNKDNDPKKGLILYLAGHKFDNDRFWGERVILNSIFARLNPLTGLELARSEPVGYTDTSVTPNTTRAYQGTYVQQPLPDSNDLISYNPAASQLWQFPFTKGHLYQYELGSISSTAQAFKDNKNWDAATRMPLPGARDLFTVVNGSANLGWKKIPFSSDETGGSCHDYDGDGKCDLSALLAACNAAGVTLSALENKGVNGAQAARLGMLVQQARGFCAAHDPPITGTPILTPSDAQCDCQQAGVACGDIPQTNRASLGGIDHGSPAVVGPSRYVTDSPWSTRPVVAYAAGHDGMLHAFYVSGGGWSAEGRSLPANVQPGQELWAFVPPGQVCGIATNDALVDGSLNVVDVFGDFPYDRNNDGVIDWTATGAASEQPDGLRRWRTVLLATAGPGGSEMFALDVTNPLKPVLLWHLSGASEKDGRWDVNGDGSFGAGETFSTSDPSTYALKWFDWDDGRAATGHIPTDYNTTDATIIDALKFGRYDYRNLGLTYSTSVAKLWTGAGYRYVAFTATTAADYTTTPATGYRGVEVFAVDVITGQRLWQWEHRYASTDATGIDNTIPPGVALGDIDASGSTDRIYVGDMEGHLWELAARDGRNVNYLPTDSGGYRSFPLFGSARMQGTGANASTKALYTVAGGLLGQQPLTTPIGEGRFTALPPSSASFDPTLLQNRLSLLVGTMGVDWAIAPFEAGHIYVVPVYPDTGTRLLPPINLAAARDPLAFGVLLPTAIWEIPLAVGERVYGMPRVANNTIVFNTAFGSFTGDISSSITDTGNLKIVTAASTDSRSNDSKSFGGVLIMGGKLVVTTDTSIHVVGDVSSLAGGTTAVRTFNRDTPAIYKTWEPVAP